MNWQDEMFYLTGAENHKDFEERVEKLDKIKLQQELQRKDNNWNKLKEWLENYIQVMSSSLNECDVQYTEALRNILDKIKELEKSK